MAQTDVETLPGDLDRFLSEFFSRGRWRSEIRYDPLENRLYLQVLLADTGLAGDDRFFSLLEFFTRAQRARLARSGVRLDCRLYAADGRELTRLQHARGSSYLDDGRTGRAMRRRLARLNLRRRLFSRLVPGLLLWALAFGLVVGVIGLPLPAAVALALTAVLLQQAVLALVTRRPGRD